MAGPDRLQELLNQDDLTGIDFVYVHEDQRTLDVYFLRSPDALTVPIVGDLRLEHIRIYNSSAGESLPDVGVESMSWEIVDDRHVLRLTTAVSRDFSLYRLRIDDYHDPDRIDRYFNDVTFSFKAGCHSDLDCKPSPHGCPPEDDVDFPVDYRARDFWSFRRALLDFAEQRYPDWKDRLEADAAVMMVEVMSALGDELAYYQDRMAREAYLETATQRRSLRHHSRLVDYQIHDGLGASTWLDVTVKPEEGGSPPPRSLPAGAGVWALSDNGQRSPYEVGRGLDDILNAVTYPVAAVRNSFEPHLWDEDDACLPVGSTELFLKGHHASDLTFDYPPEAGAPSEAPSGKWVLLRTDPVDRAVPVRRWLVQLNLVEDKHDDVMHEDITRITWDESQATPFEMDLTMLSVRGNIVPATAGMTKKALFTIGEVPETPVLPEEELARVHRAVERVGPNDKVAYLSTLPDPEGLELVWLGDDPGSARPEIHLEEVEFVESKWNAVGTPWEWRRSLLGVGSSLPRDPHFTLDDGTWTRVAGYQRRGVELVHADYVAGGGLTIRFGDDQFGLIPAKETIFRVIYRLGNGAHGNVPANAVTRFDREDDTISFIGAVSNPLPATSGREPETPTEVRQLAPDAFRALTYRAVRTEDYAEAAERLAWVQRAGAAARWTGSWPTIFATADPRGAVAVSDTQRIELNRQLDRFRQAGREAYMAEPRYADLDLKITICVEPSAYPAEVKAAVLKALIGEPGRAERNGFFAPDNFTFGTPLQRALLEAAIQAVPGVRAVIGINIRRRGRFNWRPFTDFSLDVALNEVIRVENDPLHPGRGSVRLLLEGGA